MFNAKDNDSPLGIIYLHNIGVSDSIHCYGPMGYGHEKTWS